MVLYKNTVDDLLWNVLVKLMQFDELKSFRLVGGTSLSLTLGHRLSVDIDLFTDAPYNSIDFEQIDSLFLKSFAHVEMNYHGNSSFGKSYFIGNKKDELVKVDLFYTDNFVFPLTIQEGIRLSSLEEVTAMKLEVVSNCGRKKDFWDLHELLNHFTLEEVLCFYELRYPYSFSKADLLMKLISFEEADSDFDPICLQSKYWELIKLDFTYLVRQKLNQ